MSLQIWFGLRRSRAQNNYVIKGLYGDEMDTAGVVQEGIKTYIGYVTPFVIAIIGLVVFIYTFWTHRLDDKVDKLDAKVDGELKSCADSRKADDEHCERCLQNIMKSIKEANRETLLSFKEGIKEEREFRLGVMNRQEANIKHIFERIDEIAVTMGKLESAFEEHTKYREQICNLRHKES